MPYDILGHLIAQRSILSMGTDAAFGSLFATTVDGCLLRFAERPSAPLRPTQALRQTWRQISSISTTVAHRHLAVSSHACTQGHLLVATGSEEDALIAVWRMPADVSKHSSPVPAAEFLSVPCASTALQFRPTTADPSTTNSSEVPATLMAVGCDGAIRLWLEVDAASALPASFLAAAQANGKAVGHCMCLAQVLSPPPLLPLRAPRTLATWATASSAAPAAPRPKHSSWIVATVYDSTPPANDFDAVSDQVFAWSLDIHAPDVAVRAPANGTTKGNGKARRSAREQPQSAEPAVAAGCAVPCVTAALWAHEAYRVRPPAPESPSHPALRPRPLCCCAVFCRAMRDPASVSCHTSMTDPMCPDGLA